MNLERVSTALLIIGAILLCGWLYWLTDRAMRIFDRAEQAAAALERLLPLVPGKSATRTGPPEEQHQAVPADAAATGPIPIVRPIPTDTSEAGAVLEHHIRRSPAPAGRHAARTDR